MHYSNQSNVWDDLGKKDLKARPSKQKMDYPELQSTTNLEILKIVSCKEVHHLHLAAYANNGHMLLKYFRSSVNLTKSLLKDCRYFLQKILVTASKSFP